MMTHVALAWLFALPAAPSRLGFALCGVASPEAATWFDRPANRILLHGWFVIGAR